MGAMSWLAAEQEQELQQQQEDFDMWWMMLDEEAQRFLEGEIIECEFVSKFM